MTSIKILTFRLFLLLLLLIDCIDLANTNITITTPSYASRTSFISKDETSKKNSGKWQVGRVSRKQYEIINMLWQKTKTFVEMEPTISPKLTFKPRVIKNIFDKNSKHVTLVHQNPLQESFQLVHPHHRPLTPSYIEFYYLDDSDERIKRKDTDFFKNKKLTRLDTKSDDYKIALLRPPFFIFRVNDATCKPTTSNLISSSRQVQSNRKSASSALHSLHIHYKKKSKPRAKSSPGDYTSRKPKATGRHKKTENKYVSSTIKDSITHHRDTTHYDRIKFFEIYDSHTHKSVTKQRGKINVIEDNYIQNDDKAYLDQVDHDTDNRDNQNLTRFVTKHFDSHELTENRQDKDSKVNVIDAKTSPHVTNANLNMSRPAKWSEFPFMAVYVHEPTQVRCDAAAISPHWLVASAACLFRRRMNLETDGRSAFVAYCGDSWRLPGRIAYVKRSFTHPRFQPDDSIRRYFYNIGVIQVVNSMANTCSGWQPVSLMSHQFVAPPQGTVATAVGWGLDRYDISYGASDIPNYPLMLYEGLVYSNSCPGNSEYRKAKTLSEESVKHIHCLLLPPYTLEENDSVHGSLLLVGEKLIALYLQEERRIWGVQSAQYTGIWRLIPWLLNVAHEADDLDSFISAI